MYFDIGNTVTVIAINKNNYILPLASKTDINNVLTKLRSMNFEVEVHSFRANIERELSDIENEEFKNKALKAFSGVYPYVPQSIVVLDTSFIARESIRLFEDLGITILVESGPAFIKEVTLVLDPNTADIIATENNLENLTVVGKATGRISNNIFIGDIGNFVYKEGGFLIES